MLISTLFFLCHVRLSDCDDDVSTDNESDDQYSIDNEGVRVEHVHLASQNGAGKLLGSNAEIFLSPPSSPSSNYPFSAPGSPCKPGGGESNSPLLPKSIFGLGRSKNGTNSGNNSSNIDNYANIEDGEDDFDALEGGIGTKFGMSLSESLLSKSE